MSSPNDLTPWVIVGCGRVGTALTLFAERQGIEVVAAWGRTGPPDVKAKHKLSGPLDSLAPYVADAAVFITVSDNAIASVAAALAPHLASAAVVAHCSGSLASTVLADAGVSCAVASVHPLLAVADPVAAVDQFPAAAWTIEGSPAGVWWARGWLATIDVLPFTIEPQNKVLYHAAAVTAAGLVVALMDVAFELAVSAGLEEQDARRMLLPLASSSLQNLETMSSAEALTGPIARDDEQTVERHVAAMGSALQPSTRQIYQLLTERSRTLLTRPGEEE